MHIEKSELRADPSRIGARGILWKMLRPVIVLLISGVLVGFAAVYAYNYVGGHYIEPVDVNDDEEIKVVIEPNSSLSLISETLEEYGVIQSKSLFKYYVDFSDQSTKLHSGEYLLKKSMSMDEIIRILSTGRTEKVVQKVTLFEGMTIEEMAKRLADKKVIQSEAKFLALCKTGKEFTNYSMIEALVADEANKERKYMLEGYLFPDTYYFDENTPEEDVIKRLLDQFEKVYSYEWDEVAEELGMTQDQIITLASIIEKEARTKDFGKVSAVYHNRLRANEVLASCPTVQYVLNTKRIAMTPADTSIDSPYNTYKYGGLPIGPICNPGRATMEKALRPDQQFMDEGYFYFCTKDPESGELQFSKTPEEHKRASDEYRPLWEAYDEKNETKQNQGSGGTGSTDTT